MRDIKFRAWHTEKKKIFPLWYLYGHEDTRFIKIMQYTGLKDKNGREIYEGDVIRHKEWGYSQDKESIVSYDPPGFYPFADDDDGAPYPKAEETEVIGNIYENPELFGGRDE